MPIIVDKLQKRKDIALSSVDLLITKGFHKLTVSEVAKNANVAKGTIYEYFKTKDEIVFAIIEYAQYSYDIEIKEQIKNTTSTQEKIFHLFDLCISKTSQAIQRRKIYKEFISICLSNPSNEMIKFLDDIKVKYTNWLKDILQEGINSNQLKPEAIEFVNGLFAMAEGVLIFSTFENFYEKNILQEHINSLFKLIKTGEQND